MKEDLKVGLFGIGLENYWEQFTGLKMKLENNLAHLESEMTKMHPDILNLGLIDSIDKSRKAGLRFKKENVDILFLYVTTYALSATVIPLVKIANVPVIILNLSPERAIDYDAFNKLKDRTKMTGEWLMHCSACPVPEIANVFKRMGIHFHEINGVLNDPTDSCWKEIAGYIDAAKVVNSLFYNNMGVMGHYYNGMLDIYTDLTKVYRYFGGHIQIIEVDELSALVDTVENEEIKQKITEFENEFEIMDDCSEHEIRRAAKTSVALDKIVNKYNLGSMAYYYKGTGNIQNANAMSSIILGNSLLTIKGIPVAGEYEIKNCLAMKIMDLFGSGGSFTEYYAMDFDDDVVLMGHDGPGHTRIAEGKAKVKPLQVYHGKVGDGLSIEMSVKNGPVTLLSIIEGSNNDFELLIAEGESVPGPILEIGNTNSRYRFKIPARDFVKKWNAHGPAHHCAIGVGHIAHKLNKLAHLMGIQSNQVV